MPCDAGEELPVCLEAGLRVTLEMLAGEPDPAYLLAVAPYLGGEVEAEDARREWIGRFGALLRDAAARDPRATLEPSFLAPFLIGGVRLQIRRLVLDGERSDLPRLLPTILEGLLAYYFELAEALPLARAALTTHS